MRPGNSLPYFSVENMSVRESMVLLPTINSDNRQHLGHIQKCCILHVAYKSLKMSTLIDFRNLSIFENFFKVISKYLCILTRFKPYPNFKQSSNSVKIGSIQYWIMWYSKWGGRCQQWTSKLIPIPLNRDGREVWLNSILLNTGRFIMKHYLDFQNTMIQGV